MNAGDPAPAGQAELTVVGRYGAYPAPGGTGASYLLAAGGPPLLVGCGSGTAGHLGYHVGPGPAIGGVLLPDLRPDHTADLWSIGSMAAAGVAAGRRRGLLLVHACRHPEPLWQGLARPGVLDVRRFDSADVVPAAGWTLRFCPVRHGWPGLALRAEAGGRAVALVGPSAPDADLVRLGAGVDLLVVATGGPNTGYDEGLDGGMRPREAADLARACGAGRLLLSHLDPADDPRELLAEATSVFASSALALEGRTYSLGDAL